MHFMLQKEVVERMVAVPGSSDFSRISVMLQYRFHIEWLIDVPPESFDPPPKVQSAVVRLIPGRFRARCQDEAKLSRRPDGLLATPQDAAQYAQRNPDDAGFAELGIAPTCRAEDVAVADYVRANYRQLR
jgi:16S rRNA (adenine1518-N6/adenine1519-N6)-dimethyltransferase